ncbi:MAG: hypothetical protein HUU04_03130 [Verrucomicrobiae bacterium]|nr:hypothetical protein [Verrucomicrobiae bacterium]
MNAYSRLFRILSVALGFVLAGCGTVEAPKTYISEDNLASSKEEAMALAERLPSAEEVAAPTVREEASKEASRPVARSSETAVLRQERPSPPSAAPRETSPSPPYSPPPSSPAPSFEGTVVLLNLQKGFVIVEFSDGKIPPPRSELGVYRGGTFVGSVRITPPIKSPHASADIINGSLRRGDQVR